MEDKAMKRRNKKAMVTVTCAMFATLMLMAVCVCTASASGLSATGQTVAQIESTWGKPAVIQAFNDGTEKRFYKYQNAQVAAFRYFVYKNGQAVDDGGLEGIAPEQKEQPAYKIVKQ
jgi:hypothetical protein